MKVIKKTLALLLGVLLAACLSACTIPAPGFADYDVSGYVQALLDSSYHADNGDLMAVTAMTEEQVQQYNNTTVENAAVTFCNIYGVSPSEEQLQRLEKVMKQAFSLTKYTVKDERKVETGYYLEVEIASITNFADREEDIEKLREEAKQEATAANSPQPSSEPEESSGLEESSELEESSGFEEPSQAEPPSQTVDANELFVEKVLDFCMREVANVSYDPETRTIALDILQTEDGELQLDLNQIETIDKTVVRFEK